MSVAALDVDTLAAAVTGRRDSRFAADLVHHGAAVHAAVAGRRVLVTGGAGSIGRATVRELLRHGPADLTIVDHDENALVELVRSLRSEAATAAAAVRLLPLDFGGSLLQQTLANEPPFDLVLHFAAGKHVRSDRDRASVLQLLDTNLVKTAALCDLLAATGCRGRCFAVSTDKAADPVNLMGASKRLMERLWFARGALPGCVRTAARFANVAFSAGSLLHGFLQRLQQRQPLAVPRDTWRYFVTPQEAGQLCLLAATAAPDRHVVVPALAPERDQRRLEDVAALVVAAAGHEPRWYDDAAAARAACAADLAAGRWPIVRTALDTGGEKVHEQFVARGERALPFGDALQTIAAAADDDAADVHALVAALRDELAAPTARRDRAAWLAAVQAVLPAFTPPESDHHLDQRM